MEVESHHALRPSLSQSRCTGNGNTSSFQRSPRPSFHLDVIFFNVGKSLLHCHLGQLLVVCLVFDTMYLLLVVPSI